MQKLRSHLHEVAAAGVVVPALALFALSRLLGAHWNLWLLYGMFAALFGVALRGVAAWRGWLEVPPLRPGARGDVRAHSLLRVPVWLVAGAAVWTAVLPIQLGEELGSARALIVGVSLAGVTGALFPVRNRSWLATVAMALCGGVFAYDLAAGLAPPAEPTVPLHSPFRSVATVFHGGGSPLLNHHASLTAQANAQDLVLAPGGSEVVGDPADLEGWACFHAPLVAPADGVVVAAQGDRPDMPIGEMDSEQIVGNHVVIDIGDGKYVMLAHLEQGSLEVEEGDAVVAGDPVARCGNSGNTSQPHLHIQVQNKATFSNADPELRTYGIRWAKRRRDGVEVEGVTARRNDELPPSFPR